MSTVTIILVIVLVAALGLFGGQRSRLGLLLWFPLKLFILQVQSFHDKNWRSLCRPGKNALQFHVKSNAALKIDS